MSFVVVIGLIAIFGVMTPFFWGAGGALTDGASISDPGRLLAIKKVLLERYLEDERGFEQKLISERTWRKRRSYLRNRYIDIARRHDFLISHDLAINPKSGTIP